MPPGTWVGMTWHSSLENSLKSGINRLVTVIPDTYGIEQINQAISEFHALVEARVVWWGKADAQMKDGKAA